MKEPKTEKLNLRIKPGIKALVQRMAEAEGRSVANFIEQLILEEAATNASGGPFVGGGKKPP